MNPKPRVGDDARVVPLTWPDGGVWRDYNRLLELIEGHAPDRYRKLFLDDEYKPAPERSEGDAELAVLVTRYAGPDADPALITAVMRESVRAREKWEKNRSYLALTITWARKKVERAGSWVTQAEIEAKRAARWELYTGEQLAALPEPPWLVQDVLFAGGLTLVYAEKGTYKSFVTLSLATAVATGKAWLGTRAVTQRPVVYVIAEGKGYFAKRIAALDQIDAPIRYVTVPVNLFKGEAADFAAHVRAALGEGQPGLFVFDTLARSMVGGEENSNTDMGVVVDAARLLQQTFEAAVLLVHHTGKDGLTVRGGYALQAAADIVIRLTKTGPLAVTLTFENTKDVAEPDPVGLVLRPADQSLVVQLGPIAAGRAPDRSRPPTRDELLEHVVNLCRPAALNVQEIAAATGKSVRWIAGEMIPVLLAAKPPRLTVEGTGLKADPRRYRATTTPLDTT